MSEKAQQLLSEMRRLRAVGEPRVAEILLLCGLTCEENSDELEAAIELSAMMLGQKKPHPAVGTLHTLLLSVGTGETPHDQHHNLLQRHQWRIDRSPAWAAAAVIFLAAPETNPMNMTQSNGMLTPINTSPSLARAQLGMTAQELADAFESRSLSPADLDMLLGHPEAKVLATAAILRCLGATKYYFDKTAGRMVHTPDFATQLAAAKVIFERTEGLPVTMNLNVNHNASAPKEDFDPANMSPAMIEAMERMVARARKKGTKAPGAVDV